MRSAARRVASAGDEDLAGEPRRARDEAGEVEAGGDGVGPGQREGVIPGTDRDAGEPAAGNVEQIEPAGVGGGERRLHAGAAHESQLPQTWLMRRGGLDARHLAELRELAREDADAFALLRPDEDGAAVFGRGETDVV